MPMTSPIPITWSPPGSSSRRSQATHASAVSSTGTPWATRVGHALELLARHALGGEDGRELLVAGARMLTAKRGEPRTTSSVREPRLKQTSSSSGSSDSDVTAFVVMPAGPSGPVVVTIVTPVAKWPIVSR